MDEQTERLREIFTDVADEETVTERQEDQRGTLDSEGSVEEQLRSLVAELRERYEFHTSLSTGDLVAVVRGFYDGRSDAAIARDLGVSAETVARARLDLHLVTDRDLDAPFDLATLRDLRGAGRSTGGIADELGVSPSTVRRYARALDAQAERRRAADRFRESFDRLLSDRELAERLTADATETGLEDATEGMETNVSF